MSEVRYPVQPYDRAASTRVSVVVGVFPAAVADGAMAGACDLVFGAGASALAATATLTGTNAIALVFGAGSSTLAGSAGQLAGTNAVALVFGSAADLTGVTATVDLPILVMAPRLA